jgi:1,4-alpha-glucan branching enzyme
VQTLVRDLNRLYREVPALHALDCEPRGFEWIDASDVEQSVYVFLRRGREDSEIAVVVCNFTPVPRPAYRIGVPRPGAYVERLNTDAERYGGSNIGNFGRVTAEDVPMHGRPQSVSIWLPPLATLVFVGEAS